MSHFPPSSYRVAVQPGTVSVGNVTTEETVFQKTVPAGLMGTDGMLIFESKMRFGRASAVAQLTIRYKVNGTTVWLINNAQPTVHATNWTYAIANLCVCNMGAANMQNICGKVEKSAATSGPSSQNLDVVYMGQVDNEGAFDTTLPLMIAATAQWSAAPGRTPSVQFTCGHIHVLK